MAGLNLLNAHPKEFHSWVVIYRSEDNSLWIAHTVNYNLMAWGDTPASARASLELVFEDAILDDLNSGFDSARRPNAPEEVQQRLAHLQSVGRRVDLSAPDVAEREQVKEFAFYLTQVFFPVAVEAPSGVRTLQYGQSQVAA